MPDEKPSDEDRFDNLPPLTVTSNEVNLGLFSQDGFHITNHLTLSTLPDRIGDTMEHRPYGLALKWTIRF